MNLAGFLHSLKEFKDSTLSLPIAPVFSLPSQKWHFSSPTLVPLRKRRENASFFKYLEQVDLMGEKRQTQDKIFRNKQLLCLYQNKDYLDDKVNHIFNKIYMECRSEVQNRQRIRCGCVSEDDEKNSVTFVLSTDAIKAKLQASKKHFKSQTPINKEHSINWCQFARLLTKQQTSKILRLEDQLHFYKIPEGITQQSLVFNLFWNDNFIVFNNNHMPVNQHMKAKAVELSDLLNKKLEEFIWKKVQIFIQKAEEINDYDMFIKKAKKIMKINSFKIWFYKKLENNEIYVLGLSDLSFKGVQCILFKDVVFKYQHMNQLEAKVNDAEIDQEYNDYQMNKIVEGGREKLKNLREVNKLTDVNDVLNFRSKPQIQKNTSEKLQITQIQCSCCRNLLLSNQIVNQITANKIQQVRYLRQIKIGKIQFDPYDFVKVCTTCYSAYLKHYKQSISKSKSLKCQKTQKAHSFYEKIQKENYNNKVSKEANFYLQRKIDEISTKSFTPSLRGLVRDRSLNIRAKSELNNSKEGQNIQGNLEVQTQKKFYFNNNRKKEPPRNLIAQNQRKYKTAITTNTQTVDLEVVNQKVNIKDQIVLERTFTNNEKPAKTSLQKDFLPKSRSFKLKGGGIPKPVNIINKIIMNNTDSVDKAENICSNIPKFKQQELNKWQQLQLKLENHKDCSQLVDGKSWNTKKERDTVITNAIEEYENISRPSFKKLIYKGHKNFLKREMNQVNENIWQEEKLQNRRKKSIFSYCEQ